MIVFITMTWNISDGVDSVFYYTKAHQINQVYQGKYVTMFVSPKYLLKHGYRRTIYYKFLYNKAGLWAESQIWDVVYTKSTINEYNYHNIPVDYFNFILRCIVILQQWIRDWLYKTGRYKKLANTLVKTASIKRLKRRDIPPIEEPIKVKHIVRTKKNICDCEDCTQSKQISVYTNDHIISLYTSLLAFKSRRMYCRNNILYETIELVDNSIPKSRHCVCKTRQRTYPIWKWTKPGFCELIGYTRPCYCSFCHKYRPNLDLDEPISDYTNMFMTKPYVPIRPGQDFERLPPFANFLQNKYDELARLSGIKRSQLPNMHKWQKAPYPTWENKNEIRNIIGNKWTPECDYAWNRPRWLRKEPVEMPVRFDDDMEIELKQHQYIYVK